MKVLENTEPKNVFKFFEEICSIPHPSRHTDKISQYLVNFAEQRNLEHYKDENNNVIIIKEATQGMESKEPIIIQGHMDMVCEKTQDCNIDFLNDGLDLRSDGEYIYANGTTLGGDDGIALAFALALLDSSEKMPRLECVFTTDEEIGMLGASAIDLSPLRGKYLLNIDSEEEGVLTVSCAGGATLSINFSTSQENFSGNVYSLSVSGLKGGHSGTEINNGRLNANKIMGEVLKKLPPQFLISSINGGLKDNAIPNKSECVIISSEEIKAEKIIKKISEKYISAEPNIDISIKSELQKSSKAFSFTASRDILSMLNECPNGVIKMSEDIEGLVQTSLNLGILETKESGVSFTFSVRSSVNDEKNELMEKLEFLAGKYDCEVKIEGVYPPWEYRKESRLRDVLVETFEQLYSYKPKIEAIHAGLEVGILIGKKPDIDGISFGPDILDIHTVNEKLSIASVQRTWQYILKTVVKKAENLAKNGQ